MSFLDIPTEQIRIHDLFDSVAGTLIHLPIQQLPFDTQAPASNTSSTSDCVNTKSPAHYAIMLSIDIVPVVFPTSNQTAYRVTYFPIVSYSQGEYPDMEAPLDGGHRVGDYHIPIAHSEDGAPDPFPTDNAYSHPWTGRVVFDCEAGSRRNPITRPSWVIAQKVEGLYHSEMQMRRVVGVKASFPVVQRVFRVAQELSSAPQAEISPYMVFGGDGDEVEDWDVEDYDEGEGDLEWFNSFFSSSIVQDSVRRSCRVVSDWQERNARQGLII